MVTTILLLVWSHFIFDFILQSDKMACNKSSSFKYLLLHSFIYSLGFLWLCVLSPGPHAIDRVVYTVGVCVTVFITHALVDGITSRITKRLWLAEERHWFFVVIGFDQAIHITSLVMLVVLLNMLFPVFR